MHPANKLRDALSLFILFYRSTTIFRTSVLKCILWQIRTILKSLDAGAGIQRA